MGHCATSGTRALSIVPRSGCSVSHARRTGPTGSRSSSRIQRRACLRGGSSAELRQIRSPSSECIVKCHAMKAGVQISSSSGRIPSYAHVEVKVGDPSLDKTLHAAAIQGRFHGQTRRGDFNLLLLDQRDGWDQKCRLTPDLGKRISALTWVNVARAFRFALREGVETPAWRVWAHAFCGAIEQKLLRIPAGEEPVEWAHRLRLSRLAIATELLRTEQPRDAR